MRRKLPAFVKAGEKNEIAGLGEHRGEALTPNHFARRMHRAGELDQRQPELFEIGGLPLTERSLITGIGGELLGGVAAFIEEDLKSVTDGMVNR